MLPKLGFWSKKWPYTAQRAVVRSVSRYYRYMVLHGIAWYCISLHGIAIPHICHFFYTSKIFGE